MAGARVLVTGISAATGTCFAGLAGLSLSAIVVPVRRVHIFSVIIAAVAVYLAYIAFRAATRGRTDEDTVVASLRRGITAAFICLLFSLVLLVLFGSETSRVLAHALGNRTSNFTPFRILLALVLLGFGTGFVIRMPTHASERATEKS